MSKSKIKTGSIVWSTIIFKNFISYLINLLFYNDLKIWKCPLGIISKSLPNVQLFRITGWFHFNTFFLQNKRNNWNSALTLQISQGSFLETREILSCYLSQIAREKMKIYLRYSVLKIFLNEFSNFSSFAWKFYVTINPPILAQGFKWLNFLQPSEKRSSKFWRALSNLISFFINID